MLKSILKRARFLFIKKSKFKVPPKNSYQNLIVEELSQQYRRPSCFYKTPPKLPLGFRKSSDTVFILASGESLAQVTDEQWSKIEKHDVFSVNWSVIHPFKADINFIEPVRSGDMNDIAIESFIDKGYGVLAVNNRHAFLVGLYGDGKLYAASKDHKVYSFDVVTLRPLLSQVTMSQAYRELRVISDDTLLHHCTHIGAVVDYAYVSGYKNIVLIGCDLNGSKYFSEVESCSKRYPALERYKTLNSYRKVHQSEAGELQSGVHPSMNTSLTTERGKYTAKQYFESMADFYRKNEVNLYVSSCESTLHPMLPVHHIFNPKKSPKP